LSAVAHSRNVSVELLTANLGSQAKPAAQNTSVNAVATHNLSIG